MSLKRNVVANFLGQGWTALMGIAFIPLYIHFLGIEAYGLIGFFILISAWLGLLDFGMTPTLGREMARFTGGALSAELLRDLLRSIEVIFFGISALAVLIIFGAADWITVYWLKSSTLPKAQISESIKVMGIIIVLALFSGIYRSALIGLQRQQLFNVISVIVATVRGAGAVAVLAWVSPTINAFFIWQLCVSIFSLLVLYLSTNKVLPNSSRSGVFSIPALIGVSTFVGGIVALNFQSILLMQVDKLVLSKMLTLEYFGYYTLAAVVAGALYMLSTPIIQALYPKLTELVSSNQDAEFKHKYHQGAQLITVIIGTVALIIIFFAQEILTIWTRNVEVAAETARVLSLLAVGNFLSIMMHMPYHAQLSYGWTQLAIRINIFAVIFIVPLMWWGATYHGAEGAASAWILLNVSYIIFAIHFMHRRILIGEKLAWYTNDFIFPLTVSFLSIYTLDLIAPKSTNEVHIVIRIICIFLFSLTIASLSAAHVRKQILALIPFKRLSKS